MTVIDNWSKGSAVREFCPHWLLSGEDACVRRPLLQCNFIPWSACIHCPHICHDWGFSHLPTYLSLEDLKTWNLWCRISYINPRSSRYQPRPYKLQSQSWCIHRRLPPPTKFPHYLAQKPALCMPKRMQQLKYSNTVSSKCFENSIII